ncbi:uncharacterized protein LOC128919667 [Rissa tridactyla]|uniref:uncharacterized protein LOC128919667 n=1 Tax=Rissa tridactyla TaxID=75485 RepID=UPI0023BA7ACF|nr:uncharacterized protein LOC128919667 [Rissa tridactyla]
MDKLREVQSSKRNCLFQALERQNHPRCLRCRGLHGNPHPLHQREENHCTKFPKPAPISGCLLQQQQFFTQLKLLRCGHNGFCLVLVHSSSYTEVLQKGTTLAAHQRKQMSRHAVPPLSRRASPWFPPWTWEHSLETSVLPLERRGTSRGTMSEQSNPKRQDVWKRFPGHLGENPLFNCNVLPCTASFVFHCNATLVALRNAEGNGSACC